MRYGTQAIIREGFWLMALLTGITRRAQCLGANGIFIQFENLVIGFFNPLGLPSKLIYKRSSSNMAFFACNIRMRRYLVYRILWRHCMTGSTAELRRIFIFPTIYAASYHHQCQQAKDCVRKD